MSIPTSLGTYTVAICTRRTGPLIMMVAVCRTRTSDGCGEMTHFGSGMKKPNRFASEAVHDGDAGRSESAHGDERVHGVLERDAAPDEEFGPELPALDHPQH